MMCAATITSNSHYFQGVLFDEIVAGFCFVAHEDAEEVVGCGGVGHGHLEQRAVGGVEGGVAEFFGVHFT